MPRAHRYITAGRNYHLTHRCHARRFLLKFAKDRDLYRSMLRERLPAHGVTLLGYCITSNHTHLAVGRKHFVRSVKETLKNRKKSELMEDEPSGSWVLREREEVCAAQSCFSPPKGASKADLYRLNTVLQIGLHRLSEVRLEWQPE